MSKEAPSQITDGLKEGLPHACPACNGCTPITLEALEDSSARRIELMQCITTLRRWKRYEYQPEKEGSDDESI